MTPLLSNTSTSLSASLQAGVRTLTINRPERANAFNLELLNALLRAFDESERDPQTRVIVLTGAGNTFGAGHDVTDMETAAGKVSYREHLQQTYNPLILKIRQIEKPVIAAVNGMCAGASLGVALACDLRIAADEAAFVVGFSGIGLIPDSGSTWLLPRLIGPTRALELMSTGDRLSAHDALEWGLINRVIPAEEFEATVAAWAQRLAAAPTRALGLTKRAFNQALTSTLAEALEVEAVLQDVAGATADSREGVQAFLEKRAPVFTGR